MVVVPRHRQVRFWNSHPLLPRDFHLESSHSVQIFISSTTPNTALSTMEHSEPQSRTDSPPPSRVRIVVVEYIRYTLTLTITTTYFACISSLHPWRTALAQAIVFGLLSLLLIGISVCLIKYSKYCPTILPKAIPENPPAAQYYAPKSFLQTAFDIFRAVLPASAIIIVFTSILVWPAIMVAKSLTTLQFLPFMVEHQLANFLIGLFWLCESIVISSLGIFYLTVVGIVFSRPVPDWDIFSAAKMKVALAKEWNSIKMILGDTRKIDEVERVYVDAAVQTEMAEAG